MTRELPDQPESHATPADFAANQPHRSVTDDPTKSINFPEPSGLPNSEVTGLHVGSSGEDHANGLPGQGLAALGDYELIGEIARGGMGVVYRARHRKLNREVALKVARAGPLAGESEAQRFHLEAQAVAQLDHPNIVPLFDVGEVNGLHYFAMALVEGESLAQRVADKPLPPREAAAMMRRVAEAMDYAHAHGVIHRDLKPSNILVDGAGQPRVTDFGLAKRADAESCLTQAGEVMGTPSYMPPEQAEGKTDQIGPLADVYSLGATLYCLLTGRPPFQAANVMETLKQVVEREPVPPRVLNPAVDRDLETIALKCLEKLPARRYQSARSLADDLQRFLEDRPIQARRVGNLEKAVRWCRRNRMLAGSLAAVIVALVLGTVVSAFFGIQATHRASEAQLAQGQAQNAATEARAAEAKAKASEASAKAAEADANRQLAKARFDRGMALCEQGDVNRGLFWLLESLRITPAEDADFRRVVRVNLAAWLQAAPALRYVVRHQGRDVHVGFSADDKILLTTAPETPARFWDATTGAPIQALSHAEPMVTADFSPDGATVVTLGKDRTARLWNVATGALLHSLSHEEELSCVSFSPDGKIVLIGAGGDPDQEHRAYLWDVATGESRGTLRVPGRITVALFTPDGRSIVTGTNMGIWRGEIRRWDTRTLEPAGPPITQPGDVLRFGFLPDGHTIVTSWGHGGGVGYQSTDLKTGQLLGQPWRAGGWGSGRLIPGSGTFLYHGNKNPTEGLTLQWRDPLTGKERQVTPHSSGAGNTHLRAASPDGLTCWFGSLVGRVDGRDAWTGQLRTSFLSHEGSADFQALTSDGRLLAVQSPLTPTIRVWELPRVLVPTSEIVMGDVNPPWASPRKGPGYQRVAFSPDRSRVLLAGWGDGDRMTGGVARLVDTSSGLPIGPPLRHPWENIRCVAFSPGGKVVATGAHPGPVGGGIWLWDALTGLPHNPPFLPMTNYPSALAFSPNGKLLATGDYHQAVRLWDVVTGRPVGQPMVHNNVILSVTFSPDGKTLAAGTADDRQGPPNARLWNVATCQPVGNEMVAPYRVDQVRFSPDGRTLLTVDTNGRAQRWDTATTQLLGELPPTLVGTFTSPAFPQGIPFSPDGRTFLTGNVAGLVRLWDAATGIPIRGATLQNQAPIAAAAFSTDSKLAVVGSEDGMVRLWDLVTFKPIGPAMQLQRAILDVTFTPDGRYVVAVDRSGRARRLIVPVPVEEDCDRLRLRLLVRTGVRLDERQEITPLGDDEWEHRRQELVRSEGSADTAYSSRDTEAEWHHTLATDAEQTGNTFAAIWHLDRLLTLRPNDWTLLARRARMHVQADQLVEASADYDHAQRSGGNRVTHWYQHQAADARLAQRWSQVSWYLDRIQQETPNDWMVYRDRADVLAKLDKPDESKTALEKAVELGADPPTVLRLVELLARQSQWDRTAQLLGQLEARGVLSLGVAHLHALACLRTDDAPGYRRVCAALLTAVQGRRVPPPTANGIAWLCALGPSAVEDYASAIVLAEQAVAETPEAEKHLVLNTLGAVLYRAGRYQDAARYLNESIAAGGGKGVPQDWLFLAMTLHQLGNSAEAKKWLTQALAAPLEKGDDKFWDNVETELLRREGERLIDGK